MIVLTKHQVLLLHDQALQRYGGTPGVRDDGLLDSEINAPFQTFAGEDLYPTIMEKAVHLGYGLTKNHPFYDGNKRIGALAMLTTLNLNGVHCNATNKEVSDIFFRVADGTVDSNGLLSWVIQHIIAV